MSELEKPEVQAGRRRRPVLGAAAVVGLVVVGSSVLSLQGGSGATALAGAVVSPSSASPSPSVSQSTLPSPSGSASQSGSASPSPSDYTPLPPYPTPTGTPVIGSDPVVAPGTFGWLPSWAANITTMAGRAIVSVDDGVESWNRRTLTLQLFPAGLTPEGYDYPGRTETAPINGHKAYLGQIPFGNNPDRVLMWQTDSGRWASVRASQLSAADLLDLPRVAAAVLFKDTVSPLPVRVPKVPAGLVLESVDLTKPVTGKGGYWSFLAFYRGPDDTFLRLTVESTAPHGTPTPGHTGTPMPLPGTVCREERGVRACVSSIGESDPLASVGGMSAWLDRVTLLGRDQPHWTTQAFE
ncbi:hypothetical protein ABT095_38145 [Kitasatospora sp. NPDC002227]|uniref:hypothetical protein n=1 Tax=Kitasatospora sp. NPDC002227 TaxID=3154773 RepID=UPI00331DEC25